MYTKDGDIPKILELACCHVLAIGDFRHYLTKHPMTGPIANILATEVDIKGIRKMHSVVQKAMLMCEQKAMSICVRDNFDYRKAMTYASRMYESKITDIVLKSKYYGEIIPEEIQEEIKIGMIDKVMDE